MDKSLDMLQDLQYVRPSESSFTQPRDFLSVVEAALVGLLCTMFNKDRIKMTYISYISISRNTPDAGKNQRNLGFGKDMLKSNGGYPLKKVLYAALFEMRPFSGLGHSEKNI